MNLLEEHPDASKILEGCQQVFTCWKLAKETLEQGVKYVQT